MADKNMREGLGYFRGLLHTNIALLSPPHETEALGSKNYPKGKFLECFTPNGLGPIFSPRESGFFLPSIHHQSKTIAQISHVHGVTGFVSHHQQFRLIIVGATAHDAL